MKRNSIIALGVVGFLTLSLVLFVRSQGRALDREIALTRKAGLPATIQDLDLKPRNPAQNAGPVYQEIIRSLPPNASGELRDLTVPTGQTLTASEKAIVKKYWELADNVVAATNLNECVFLRNWEDPWLVRFPEFGRLKEFNVLLGNRAVERARAGDNRGATSDVRAMFRLASHIAQEPTLIAFLVGVALEAQAMKSLAAIFAATPSEPELSTEMRVAIKDLPEPPSLLHALKGEMVMYCDLLKDADEYRQTMSELDPQTLQAVTWLRSNWLSRTQAQVHLLRVYRKAFKDLEAAGDDPAKRQLAITQLDESLYDAPVLVKPTLSNFTTVYAALGSSVERSKSARALLPIQLWLYEQRAKTGKFPTTLPKNIPPLASWKGAPPYYQTDGKTFVLSR